MRRGFTLIEMMVVVAVLAIIAGIGSSMLFSILRGSTKTQTMLMVKQQGEFAISVMSKMIRNARKIEYENNDPDVKSYNSNLLKIDNPDSGQTTFFCTDTDGNSKFEIASSSAVTIGTADRLTSNDVAVESCGDFFAVTKGVPGINPDTVRINFKLSPATQGTRPEEQSTVTFDTTVSLRNY